MSASKYTEGFKDALGAVKELLAELAQDSFIEEEAAVIIDRAIRLQLTPRSNKEKIDDAKY